MTVWKFIKDEWLLMVGWLFFVALTGVVMWLSPGLTVDWSTLGYLFVIEGVLLIIFMAAYYILKKNWWDKLTITEDTSTLQNYLEGANLQDEQLVQDYINQLIREHQGVMQSAISNQQDQKDYIDSWVHEIKVPLAAIQLLIHSIEYEIDDSKFTLLENELSKIDEYVEQVLYYARLDSFSRDYLIREYSLKAIIQPVMRSQANYFIQKNIHYSILGEDLFVLTDGKWVGFIFRQILSNAIKYTPKNGEITITITRRGTGILLSLKDTGIGIPKQDIRRIFDKGFTGENGRLNEQHSTGLGLYLAKNLAEKLGIELTVESVENQGTTMNLFFPALTFYSKETEEPVRE
ncbi:histidine kinase [Enterococcus sp. JM4C]|uniref:two-component system sensor histidine kinase SapS n=1 Tax=Candidatus Enterococcus huntleyi TaxID=1857217 RepID=UPI00137AC163|nr:sensor histidine kinase [Enterococcus sp. JM4C]KAF1295583.1 histidine kinase [Enterococcus sp. JM4C]